MQVILDTAQSIGINSFELFVICLLIPSMLLKSKEGVIVIASIIISSSVGSMKIGAGHYIVNAGLDFAFLALACSMRLSLGIITLFFISILYNALSYIEFNTRYDILYQLYPHATAAIMIGMIANVYKKQINGFFNSIRVDDLNCDSRDSGVSSGDTQ